MIKLPKCANIFWRHTNVFQEQTKGKDMSDNKRYFVVTEKAVPEVLLEVVEAKKLLESKRSVTVQEAVEAVGISRSSFYKYKDDICLLYTSRCV